MLPVRPTLCFWKSVHGTIRFTLKVTERVASPTLRQISSSTFQQLNMRQVSSSTFQFNGQSETLFSLDLQIMNCSMRFSQHVLRS